MIKLKSALILITFLIPLNKYDGLFQYPPGGKPLFLCFGHCRKNHPSSFYTDAGYQMNEEKRLLLELERIRTFIVKPRSNMKKAEKLLLYKDALWVKKRPTFESAIDIQKVHLDLILSRQRLAINGFTTIYTNLVAYSFYPNKPSADVYQPIYELKTGLTDLNIAA